MAVRKTVVTIANSLELLHFNGLVRDCSNSIANALELQQSCTKPLIYEPSHRYELPVQAILFCQYPGIIYCFQIYEDSIVLQSVFTNTRERLDKAGEDSMNNSDTEEEGDNNEDGDEEGGAGDGEELRKFVL